MQIPLADLKAQYQGDFAGGGDLHELRIGLQFDVGDFHPQHRFPGRLQVLDHAFDDAVDHADLDGCDHARFHPLGRTAAAEDAIDKGADQGHGHIDDGLGEIDDFATLTMWVRIVWEAAYN